MFSAWIAQLANYALITILTVMVAALLLQVVQSYAAQTAARGSAIFTVDALNMLLIAVLVLLILRQIMPIAAGLAGGLALNSFGLVSGGLRWGMANRGVLWPAATYSVVGTAEGASVLGGKVFPRMAKYGNERSGEASPAAPGHSTGDDHSVGG
jgi:type IV secretion system protein VirB6